MKLRMYETYQILQEKMISRFSGLLTEAEILLGLLRNFAEHGGRAGHQDRFSGKSALQ